MSCVACYCHMLCVKYLKYVTYSFHHLGTELAECLLFSLQVAWHLVKLPCPLQPKHLSAKSSLEQDDASVQCCKYNLCISFAVSGISFNDGDICIARQTAARRK